MLLDPYYRTIQGFQILIEKDWVSFGHMFGKRCDHLQEKDGGLLSPVFIQFLDCVYQIWHQLPSQFEFNCDLLLFLADSLYSCKYGNWLFNSEYERQYHGVKEKTISIWMEVTLRTDAFRNAYYRGGSRITQIPVTQACRLRVWRELFFKYSESPSDPTY